MAVRKGSYRSSQVWNDNAPRDEETIFVNGFLRLQSENWMRTSYCGFYRHTVRRFIYYHLTALVIEQLALWALY